MHSCRLSLFWNTGNDKNRSFLCSTGYPDHFDTHIYCPKLKFADQAFPGILEMVKFVQFSDLLVIPIILTPNSTMLIKKIKFADLAYSGMLEMTKFA